MVGGRRVDDRHAVTIARRKEARVVRLEAATGEGAHQIEPRLRGAVHEAAIDPTSHHVDLQRHQKLIQSKCSTSGVDKEMRVTLVPLGRVTFM